MSRVLITHIGFVTMVLLAPATTEDQKLIRNWFCTRTRRNQVSEVIPGYMSRRAEPKDGTHKH
jgi:hypothetical protein